MLRVAVDELDVEACVTSGQVFRFEVVGDRWTIWEGSSEIRAELHGDEWCLQPAATAKSLFRLEVSAGDIEADLVACEPRIAEVVRQHRGLRVLRCSSAVETLFAFLCTPNNNLARIRKMVREMGSLGQNGAFPSVDVLALLQEGELRDKGFGYRAPNICNAARQILAKGGSKWLEGLRRVGQQVARHQLMELAGVGPKVADCVSLFGLHHLDSVPLDIHMWRAACALYAPEWASSPPSGAKYDVVSGRFREVFGPLSGWAQQFLFFDRLKRAERQVILTSFPSG